MTLTRSLAKHAAKVKRVITNSGRSVVSAGRKIRAVVTGPCRLCGGQFKKATKPASRG